MKNGDTKDDDSLSDELGLSLDKRIANIILHIEDGYENIRRHYISYERVSTPTVQPQFPKFSDPSAMDDEEIESISPYQKCLLYTLEETYKCGYRRYKGHCCEEIKTIEGYRTRAWNPIFPIDQFVYSIAQKIHHLQTGKTLQVREVFSVRLLTMYPNAKISSSLR